MLKRRFYKCSVYSSQAVLHSRREGLNKCLLQQGRELSEGWEHNPDDAPGTGGKGFERRGHLGDGQDVIKDAIDIR